VKLHDLRPVPGSRRERTRVGRGIAAGKGKTAGRGTKGQRSRTGSSIPAWFEGGQTPIHMRVPKLHGFKNRFRTEYAIVNLGRIEAALESNRLPAGPKGAPATVNAELLFEAGLVGRLDRPLKVLGTGELTHKIMAVADAFSGEARRKIEAAGGSVMVLEVPGAPPRKTKRSDQPVTPEAAPTTAEAEPTAEEPAPTTAEAEPTAEEPAPTTAEAEPTAEEPAPKARRSRAKASGASAQAESAASAQPEPSAAAEPPKADASEEAAAEPAAKPARRARKAPEQTA
jgi:large subunit ribosomal protein L15